MIRKKAFTAILAAVMLISCFFSTACESTAKPGKDTSGSQSGNAAAQNESGDSSQGDMNMIIKAGGKTFTVTLENNETAAAIKEMLPMTIDMEELNGNEKYHYFSGSFPVEDVTMRKINEGDIMMYGSSCIVVFYKTFTSGYRYTPVGHIDDTEGLRDALGAENVEVTFEKK